MKQISGVLGFWGAIINFFFVQLRIAPQNPKTPCKIVSSLNRFELLVALDDHELDLEHGPLVVVLEGVPGEEVGSADAEEEVAYAAGEGSHG